MPSFEGRARIVLQPNTLNMPYRFDLPIASAVDADDGVVPHGRTVASVEAFAYDSAGNDVTDEIILSASSNGDDYAIVPLSYPAVSGEGEYKVTIVYTMAGGSVTEKDEADFDRIFAVDL